MKPVLLVIDVQKAFFKNARAAESLSAAIEYINAAIDLFRERHLPIVCVQDVDKEMGVVPGKIGFDLPQNLNILPSDLHIHKTYRNSFNRTPLGEKLRELGVDTVIITGYSAERCVLSTYRGAEDLDLTPIILRGALASDNQENIEFVEHINNIISYESLRKVLQ